MVGVITKLFQGDIAGAFDTAFGKGTWNKIQTFVTNLNTFMGNMKKAVDDVTRAINTLNTAISKIYSVLGSGKPGQKSLFDTLGIPDIPLRGGGGPVLSGNSYVVGDRGPEVFTPRVSGNITPNSRIGSGGQSLALTVNINSAVNLADRSYAERELMPYIEAGVRQLMARAA